MKLDFGLKGNMILQISQKEKEELDQLRVYFKKELEEYALHEREELDCNLSLFLRAKDKIAELQRIRMNIIHNLAYDSQFKKLVILKDGRVLIPDISEFYHFANAYNILDDPHKGMAVLRNHILVQVIEFLIISWHSKEPEIEIEFCVEGSTEDKSGQINHPFTEKGLQFFKHCVRDYPVVNRRFLSNIYHYFKSRHLIRGNQLDFAHYYNKNYNTPTIRVYTKKAGLDPMEWKHPSVRFLEEEERKFFSP